jgi:hypothetical protein
VLTERRGVYAGTLKIGNSTTPGILFGEYREDPKELKNLVKELKKSRAFSSGALRNREKGESKRAFMPASLKNGTFQTDKQLFGEDPGHIRELLKTAVDMRKRGHKWSPGRPKGSADHMGAFKPAYLGKTVYFKC